MSILTYITEATIRDNVQTIEGEVVTRPALSRTDPTGQLTWAVDVRISTSGPAGVDPVVDGANRILRSVPIASSGTSSALSYVDVGAAVTLTRTRFGRFEITGFAKTKPGRRIRIPVDCDANLAGATQDVSYVVRPLTLYELGNGGFGAFGSTPLGAYGVYIGTTLLEVRA